MPCDLYTCDIVQFVQCCTLVVFYQFYLTIFKKAFYLQQTENEETLEMTSPTPRL